MSGRREIAYGLGGYAAYLLVRGIVWNDRGRERAAANAGRIAAWEHRWGLDVEARVQRIALRSPRLVRALSAGYAAGNVGLSVGWLLWLYGRRDPAFAFERRAALVAFLGALPAFASFPTAPPRTLPGFVDMLGGDGEGLDHPLLQRFYNPIAAMPSHHLAFAVVSGVGLAQRSRGRWRRRGWLAYPGVVATVVVATANHFVADVAAGAVLGGVARRVARWGRW